MTDRVWSEINAQPLKSPPAWAVTIEGGEPIERCPKIGPTLRLHGEPPCPECGNKGRFHCDCEVEQ
jgi:hypothetical protein